MNRASERPLALSVLREELARAELLPRAYAQYRPVVADALVFFLERLSSPRLRRLLAEQLDFAADVPAAQRVVALTRHLPALHKLGQVVARDRRLTPGFRRWLQQLESLAPLTPPRTVVRLLGQEFRGWRKAGVTLAARPLAEGSVAVIMPFTWHQRSRTAQQGVFKLLKPGIKAKLEEDLEILMEVATFLDEECEVYRVPALDYRETFETIKRLLLHEVRFETEQRNLAEAASVCSRMPGVAIPGLLPFCFRNLTAMERLPGRRLPVGGRVAAGMNPHSRASAIAEALVAGPVFSTQPAALFHADPHAGNLLMMPDGRVGLLDWSLAGRLTRQDRASLMELLLGALGLDVERMAAAVMQLSRRTVPLSSLRDVLLSSLRDRRRPVFPGLSWLTGLLDQLALRAGVRFHANLLLFRKSLLTLEGVLGDLTQAQPRGSAALLDGVVMGRFLAQWAAEWPGRLVAPFAAKSPATHISNADLLQLAWASPITFGRWLRHTFLLTESPGVSSRPPGDEPSSGERRA